MNKQNYLYGYLFTFNHSTGLWHAFKSEGLTAYFNEGKSDYSAKNIDYIIETLSVKEIRQDKQDNEKNGY